MLLGKSPRQDMIDAMLQSSQTSEAHFAGSMKEVGFLHMCRVSSRQCPNDWGLKPTNPPPYLGVYIEAVNFDPLIQLTN